MKRVLVITYYWPPSGGSGVQRWVKFAKYLPQEGWEPVIYAPEGADYPSLDQTMGADLPSSLEVIRHPIWEPYAVYRRLMGGSKTSQGPVTEISSGRKTWKQKLSLWIRANLFVPDPRVGWVRPSVKFLKKYLEEHPVDVIVTTGPPHSVHLIGQKLHRALGTPWIPDFRDPWSRMYYLKYLPMLPCVKRRILHQEQSVLDECTTVLVVTPVVREQFMERTATPVAMITNGYDAEDFASPAPEADGFFNLSHTGLLASDGNPRALWKVLGEMVVADREFRDKLRIRLSGKVDREILEDIKTEGLEDNLTLLGYVDHPGAVAEQRLARVLLLPLRNDPDYSPILPGKLFEYLAARRPILGIGQEDGAMARVIADASAGDTFDWNNRIGIRGYLERAWEEFKNSGDVPATTGDIEKYSRRNTTAALAELLEKTTKQQ